MRIFRTGILAAAATILPAAAQLVSNATDNSSIAFPPYHPGNDTGESSSVGGLYPLVGLGVLALLSAAGYGLGKCCGFFKEKTETAAETYLLGDKKVYPGFVPPGSANV